MANELQLGDKLIKAGFNDPVLLESLVRLIGLGIPSFELDHLKMFGTDLVEYKLHFHRIDDAGNYGVDYYDANYTIANSIAHKEVDGIDTFQLEERMRKINWNVIPNDLETIAEVKRLTAMLWQLRQSDDLSGFNIQQQLQLKYWKDTPYDSLGLQEKRKQFQRTRKFGMTDTGLFNAFLCYYELSGARQGIKDIFRRRGFNCGNQIDDHLGSDQAFFELNTYKSCAEGLMYYRVPVRRIDYDNFLIPEFTATLVKIPSIEPQKISEVDLSKLESAMSAIDWSDPDSYSIRLEDGKYVHNSEVNSIKQMLLEVLPNDPAGRIVSSRLQARYWVTSPDFYNLVEPVVFDYLQTLSYTTYDFPIDTHTKAAYNLLCGRAVHVGIGYEAEVSEDLWWKLEAREGDNARLFLLPFSSISKERLEQLVRHIPASESELASLISNLLEGDRAEVRLNTGKSIWVEADVEEHTLKLLDELGAPVRINLNMSAAGASKNPLTFRPFLSEQEILRPAKGLFRSKRR